ADRHGAALVDPRDRAVGLRGPAPVPERGGRARHRSHRTTAPRPPARGRAAARSRAHGPALRAADDRPRPAPLRRGDDRRAGARRAAPAAARAAVRPRTPRRARAGRSDPRARHGSGRPRRVTIRRVSHLDELDEFEAEAELRLKKEYSAVFSLFRYCVLTQDATYLCNKLEMQVVPQANYPFFHLRMEDVWVWDKNRPTRMIPRAEVYTSSDVTVEELRGEGDEPVLTPEALAKRIGEGRSEIEDL